MEPGQPSRTAFGAAAHRAAHQVLDRACIFSDPLAIPILGVDAEAAIQDAREDPTRRGLRLFLALRSRVAEDALSAALARGVRQVVVLGAGLDTWAYRTSVAEGVRVFEVDHPATQVWKRRRLAEAGIKVPSSLTYVAVDFERDVFLERLTQGGFDRGQPTFFTWLGVVPYLSEAAIFTTLSDLAALPGGAEVVFDYGNPPAPGSEEEQESLAQRVAALGEPIRTRFETDELHARLAALRFRHLEDFGPNELRRRYFGLQEGADSRGGHVLRASTA